MDIKNFSPYSCVDDEMIQRSFSVRKVDSSCSGPRSDATEDVRIRGWQSHKQQLDQFIFVVGRIFYYNRPKKVL